MRVDEHMRVDENMREDTTDHFLIPPGHIRVDKGMRVDGRCEWMWICEQMSKCEWMRTCERTPLINF